MRYKTKKDGDYYIDTIILQRIGYRGDERKKLQDFERIGFEKVSGVARKSGYIDGTEVEYYTGEVSSSGDVTLTKHVSGRTYYCKPGSNFKLVRKRKINSKEFLKLQKKHYKCVKSFYYGDGSCFGFSFSNVIPLIFLFNLILGLIVTHLTPKDNIINDNTTSFSIVEFFTTQTDLAIAVTIGGLIVGIIALTIFDLLFRTSPLNIYGRIRENYVYFRGKRYEKQIQEYLNLNENGNLE